MSATDLHHDRVVQALIADGWTITDDPLAIPIEERDLFVDLDAERTALAAEKGPRKIAVEIQSFLGRSPVRDLEQYVIRRMLLMETDPDRVLFLALPRHADEGLLSERLGQFLITSLRLRIMIFDDVQGEIVRWIEPPAIEPS